MHVIVLGVLLMSGLAVSNPDLFKNSFASLTSINSTEKPVVQNATTDTTRQMNIKISDARFDAATKTASVTIDVSGSLPNEPFIVSIGTDAILVSPGQLSLDHPLVVAIPLSQITPVMQAVVDEKNILPESNEGDNYLPVLEVTR